jgi:hypothetical protein
MVHHRQPVEAGLLGSLRDDAKISGEIRLSVRIGEVGKVKS